MDAYTSFAAVYDTFMDNIPYEEWKRLSGGIVKRSMACRTVWCLIWDVEQEP